MHRRRCGSAGRLCQFGRVVSPSILLTSWWKAGMASENISGAATPCDSKNLVQEKFGVSLSASASVTGL